MKHKFVITALLSTFLLLTACASLKSVSVSPLPKDRSKEVKANSDEWNFLGLAFSNDFANEVVTDLAKQCPDGEVTGILTKYSSYWYVLVSKREVVARGYCIPFGGAAPVSISTPTTSTAVEESSSMEK